MPTAEPPLPQGVQRWIEDQQRRWRPDPLLRAAGCDEGHRPECKHFPAFDTVTRKDLRAPCARGYSTCPCCRWLPACMCGVEPPLCLPCFPVCGHSAPCFWADFGWGITEAKAVLKARQPPPPTEQTKLPGPPGTVP